MEISCKCVGMLSGGKWDKAIECNRRVYSPDGISPTITTCGGGNQEVKIAEPQPIIITGMQKHQSIKTNGICNTLPAAMWMGGGYTPMIVEPSTVQKDNYIAVPQATKQGYIECELGGVADLSYPNSKTRRGRVQEGGTISPTITAESNGLCRIEPCIGAIRGRNPENPSDRTAGVPTQQRLEVGGDCSNTLTTVQKDNVVIEPSIRVRKLTPRECFRLMGFSDEDFDKAASVNSNSQLYKQAGNSIVVNVLTAILGQMIDGKEDVYKQSNP